MNQGELQAAVLRLASDPAARARLRANNLRLAGKFDSARQHRGAAKFLEQLIRAPKD